MKATRLLLAALAISIFSAACNATDITSPQGAKAPTEVQRGVMGSGAG